MASLILQLGSKMPANSVMQLDVCSLTDSFAPRSAQVRLARRASSCGRNNDVFADRRPAFSDDGVPEAARDGD
jgi:hypothetical protein